MAHSDFVFFHSLRVRWAEVDPIGVVFNGHYGAFIHVAFTEYLRALGLPNAIQQQQTGRVLYVRKSGIDYLASARFDDQLEIGFRCVQSPALRASRTHPRRPSAKVAVVDDVSVVLL